MNDSPGIGALAALVIFIVASVWLGTLAHRVVQKSSFLKGYFLGNRGLGAWAIALTATVQSGGTFMGFPSLVYSHGWIVALWIGSYMAVPLTGFAVLGKRFAQLSRRTGAITLPDLFRARFASPAVGLTASLSILFFMSFMMVAQFKSGALIMKISWPGSGALALSEDAANYVLSQPAIETLRQKQVPDPVLRKLDPLLGVPFKTDKEMAARVAELLSADEAKKHSKAIVTQAGTDWLYYLGLAIFTLTVVGYTLIGGFLAAVWTDLFQSVMMFAGVLLLVFLVVPAAGGLEQATLTAMDNTGPGFAFGPGFAADGREFLPLGMAFSFFMVWVFNGLGSPAGLVRVMAAKNTETLRKSVFLLSIYNSFIYIPLIMICVAARAILPDLKASDEVIPRITMYSTREFWGGSFLAGLILAAPFGAVMSTVSSYLIVISSGIIRDIYQRFINPQASDRRIRWLTYSSMIAVGAIAVLANINPVDYLQALVVFSGSCGAAAFVMPSLMAAFWRRATAPGAMAAMLAGMATVLGLFITGWVLSFYGHDPMIGQKTAFRAYYLLGLEPVVWGLLASVLAGVIVSLLTKPMDEAVVSPFFDVKDT